MKPPLPELARASIRPQSVRVAQTLPYQDWIEMRDGETLTMTTQELPGVTVTLPEEDWAVICDILQSHYHAQSTNPAVNDAWLKYRMLRAMIRR
jgi:hypothetical protein